MLSFKIQTTKNYDLFFFLVNRPIKEWHVKEIMGEIIRNDKGPDCPLKVSKEKDRFGIIDGQHTFLARQRLGLEIFYLETTLKVDDIAKLNRMTLRWSLDDHIRQSAALGNKNCQWIISKAQEWGVSSLVVLNLLGRTGSSKIAQMVGNLDLTSQSIHKAISLYNQLLAFKPILNEQVFKSKFISALRQLMNHPHFEKSRLEHVIATASRSFEKQRTPDDYLKQFISIYNWNLKGIRLTMEDIKENNRQQLNKNKGIK